MRMLKLKELEVNITGNFCQKFVINICGPVSVFGAQDNRSFTYKLTFSLGLDLPPF